MLEPFSPFPEPARAMTKFDACTGRLVRQVSVSIMTRNVDLGRRQRRNTFLILVAAPFVAFATWFVTISALLDALYARSAS